MDLNKTYLLKNKSINHTHIIALLAFKKNSYF